MRHMYDVSAGVSGMIRVTEEGRKARGGDG